MFSRSAEYAIRAMTFLASQPTGKLTGAREISQAEQIPMPFLWKILQNLAHRKLVRSFKGVGGGYVLARPAGEIRVQDVLLATEDRSLTEGCVLGLAVCSEEKPCPMHSSWKEIREKLRVMVHDTTIADLARIAEAHARKHLP
jgi:Rrf2 family iron-sulfur cluster assembly transcriptional regulator